MVEKGQNPYSEMYGIIKAEYDTENYENTTVLDAVRQYDKIYVAGESESHCVLASIMQIAEYFADKPNRTRRITLLIDCTSPISGYEAATTKAYAELRAKYGIQILRSTEVNL